MKGAKVRRSMGSHQSASMKSDEWLTPRWILDALGEFDLDPCSPVKRPWPTAKHHFTKKDDGLSLIWHGRVWLNPPFGQEWPKWAQKMLDHGRGGIMLIPARTETAAFFNYVWAKATAILFVRTRPYFCHVDGTKGKLNSGAPICLIAYGEENARSLYKSGLGQYLRIAPRREEA